MPGVVITGMGVVTPIGVGVPALWRNLLAGATAAAPAAGIDPGDLPGRLACEVRQDLPGAPAPPGPRRGRATALLAAAVAEGLGQSGVRPGLERVGLCVGTTMGEIGAHEDDLLAGRTGTGLELSGITRQIADRFHLTGPTWTLTNACAAGNYALARAHLDLMSGRAGTVVACGVDMLSWVAFAGFSSLRAMARERCQPFDRHRQGLILGEGAAALVLETEEHARHRGAAVLARMPGYGLSCDARHPTHPDAAGMALAMERALRHAGLRPEQIDYVSAHGTGTPNNDRSEAQAIHLVFGDGAPRVPVSSIKAQIGHTLGAASATEAVVCVQALREGVVPATMNLVELDPECRLDVVPNEPRAQRLRYVMSNGYAFGGNNSAVILAAAE